MSAFNNRWKCGVCSRVVRPEDLVVDGFVLEVIKATSDASGRPTCDSVREGCAGESGGERAQVHLDKRTLDWSVDPSDYASGSGEESEGEGGGGLSNTKEEEEVGFSGRRCGVLFMGRIGLRMNLFGSRARGPYRLKD